MKVLFIVTSFWAYGELIIAMNFAKKLAKDGHKPHFLIPPKHKRIVDQNGYKNTVLIPKAGKINRILMKDIEYSISPNLVILSDFLNYNYCEVHYGITKEDLSIFSGKIATFDNFSWELKRNGMDSYGFNSNVLKEADINLYKYKICPCPIVNQKSQFKKGHFMFSIGDNDINITDDFKKKYRNELNLPLDKKIILVTVALWQQVPDKYKEAAKFVEESEDLFYKLLEDLSKENLILCIGESNRTITNENIIKLKSMNTDEFDKYAAVSDLYLGRNLTSTSMIRVALSGIPCAIMMNSKCEGKEKYGYYMFPVGWYHFLEPVFKDNLYSKVITFLEQYEVDKNIKKINEILYNDKVKQIIGKNVEKLKSELRALKSPSEIINEIVYGEDL